MEGIGNSEGVGEVKDPGNSRGEGDWMLDSLSKILSCLQSRSFTWKNCTFNKYLYLNLIIFKQIGLITVFDAILTGRQSGQKLQCLYGDSK